MGIVLIVLCLVVGVVYYSLQRHLSGFIYNVRLGDNVLDRLPLAVAQQRVEEVCRRLQRQRITLQFADDTGRVLYSRTVGIAELGITPDPKATWQEILHSTRRRNPLLTLAGRWISPKTAMVSANVVYAVNHRQVSRFFGQVGRIVERPPRDARLLIGDNGSRQIVPEQAGMKLPREAVEYVISALQAFQTTASIPLQVIPPRVTSAHLQTITTPLAQASTRFSERERNRSHNIRQATERVNGVVLLPGDVFSYNQTVGPRTLREGFRKAPVIVNGELVPGDGGGVCQVSSTLYMAALQAGLQIVQRNKHAFPIGYAPAGLDATVVYGVLDLRFRNNTEYPIAIIAQAKRGRMQVSIWGAEQAKRQVRIQRIVHSVTGVPVKTVPAPNLPAGVKRVVTKGHAGMRVSVYRIIEEPGKPPRREKISIDTYRPQTRVVMVGQAEPQKASTDKPEIPAEEILEP